MVAATLPHDMSMLESEAHQSSPSTPRVCRTNSFTGA